MAVLILKLNATGDVVRTTTLVWHFHDITWITSGPNVELFDSRYGIRALDWAARDVACDRHYDLIINLEDDEETAAFVDRVDHRRVFGACFDTSKRLAYTEDAAGWFDMSLISVYGREQADRLKLHNRRTYQELIFEGLGLTFSGERYVLPAPAETSLRGDVAIAPIAGPVWPMKGWAYYDQLKQELEAAGLQVNVLPRRDSLLEHMGDVTSHKCLVSGDSLPMHFALATGTPCVTLFNCTSPWEIHDYRVQTKLVSPLLERFFYKRTFDRAATTAIGLDEVFDAVMRRLRQPSPMAI